MSSRAVTSSCRPRIALESPSKRLKWCSKNVVEKSDSAATIAGRQYEIIRCIQKYLTHWDLSRSALVNQMWRSAAAAGWRQRRRSGQLRWVSAERPQLHKHYELCGNNLVNAHLDAGLLEAVERWVDDLRHRPHIVLCFGTGVAYLYYLYTRNVHFVVQEELEAVRRIHELFPEGCESLFLTSLRLINPCPEGDDASQTLDFNVISLPEPTEGSVIRTLFITDRELIRAQIITTSRYRTSSADDINVKLFEYVTGVNVREIKGIVIINSGDFINVVRSVWRKVGKFPLALCESEGMTAVMKERGGLNLDPQDFAGCTSGLIVTGDKVVMTSQVLDVDTVTEPLIAEKLRRLSGEEEEKGRTSFGIMLTSCMRGYDGYDIGREHVDHRNKVQAMEARAFKDLYPDTPLLVAQVEDVLGSDVGYDQVEAVYKDIGGYREEVLEETGGGLEGDVLEKDSLQFSVESIEGIEGNKDVLTQPDDKDVPADFEKSKNYVGQDENMEPKTDLIPNDSSSVFIRIVY